MIRRCDVIACARTYLGTPYHHVGRVKGVGIDCVGLLYCLGRELQIPGVEHDLLTYSRRPDGVTLKKQLALNADEIPLKDAIVGDMLLFWIRRPQLITHAALMTPVGILHTHTGVGKVVEHAMDESWTERLAGAFRYRGLEDMYYADNDVTSFVAPQQKPMCGNC